MRLFALVSLLALGLVPTSPASALLVNNGLAPPGHNVFDSGQLDDFLHVRNVGCGDPADAITLSPCASPGAPTGALLDGAILIAGILFVGDTSTATLAGGEVGQAYALGSASLTMTGGDVVGLFAVGTSVPFQPGIVLVADSASALITGGRMGNVWAGGQGMLTMTGGSFDHHFGATKFVAVDEGTLVLVGSQFAIDGAPVAPGAISLANGLSLSGVFESGEAFDGTFRRESGASILLVLPEPAAGATLGAAVLGLVAFARRATGAPGSD
ncbi:MAG: hypothetical protein JRH10_18850 [Deltaproteobacteria bacterium]|nr:hypothetical protein [Deltaproteobacteria bacterium]